MTVTRLRAFARHNGPLFYSEREQPLWHNNPNLTFVSLVRLGAKTSFSCAVFPACHFQPCLLRTPPSSSCALFVVVVASFVHLSILHKFAQVALFDSSPSPTLPNRAGNFRGPQPPHAHLDACFFEQQLASVAHLRSDTWPGCMRAGKACCARPLYWCSLTVFDSPGCCVVSCLVAQLQFVVRRGNFVVRGRLCGFFLLS